MIFIIVFLSALLFLIIFVGPLSRSERTLWDIAFEERLKVETSYQGPGKLCTICGHSESSSWSMNYLLALYKTHLLMVLFHEIFSISLRMSF